MKTLAQVRQEAIKTWTEEKKEDFLLYREDLGLRKATWLDPYLGVFEIDGIKGAIFCGDLEEHSIKAI